MASKRILQFPADFLWGCATSSYQCEGRNTNSQWCRWEQQGKLIPGESCGGACDWWHQAEVDFDLAEQMENNALRLSLEWSRIEPEEGRWDTAAIDRYRAMLSDLHRRHIMPIVTLHHFSEPLWFADRGGFAHTANIPLFVRYVNYVTAQLRDLCDFWLTLNEINVYAVMGYLLGSFPPGGHDIVRTSIIIRNMLQAHIEAFYAITAIQPEARIGYCLHYRPFEPARRRWPLDALAAAVEEEHFNWVILRAAETGNFPFPLNVALEPLKRASGARDYHGVNYYTHTKVRFGDFMTGRFDHLGAVINDPGLGGSFGESYPYGLYRILKGVYQRTRGNKPLYVTENGFNDAADECRPRAILEHVAQVYRAIQEGIPVRGYLHWTLTDNFEWNKGWSARFGLIELDPMSQRRTPRSSASLFGEICRANAITEEIVERYAPDNVDTIFRWSEMGRGGPSRPNNFIIQEQA